MRYPEPVEQALALLAVSDVPQGSAAPGLHRALWKLGIPVPPPHFAGFGFNFAVHGLFFALCWGATMWVLVWSDGETSTAAMLAGTLVAGLGFGLAMADRYRRQSRGLGLPPWNSLRRR